MREKPSVREVDRIHASLLIDVSTTEVERLLHEGWDPNWRDRDGCGMLHNAVAYGHTALVTLLLERRGIEIDMPDKRGYAPLHAAAMSDRPWAVRLLVEHGAQIDPRDGLGNTPLFNAVYNYRTGSEGGAILELLRCGADVDAPNRVLMTPRRLAFAIANTDVRRFFQPLS